MLRAVRRHRVAAATAGALALLLAPVAGATIHADLAAGTLTLADVAGTADELTISSNPNGLFVADANKADTLAPACRLVSAKFHGYQCDGPTLVRLDAGAGADRVDASRISTPLQATLGAGSDVLIGGSGNDTVASVADGVRDVVQCGGGQDVVDGLADPNDDIATTCETAQRSFVASMLPKSSTVASNATVTFAIGRANVPLSFVATLATAPPKHGKHAKARSIAQTSAPAGTGIVKLRFKLPSLSKGFLRTRPSIRVEVDVTAVAADGHRYPLSLHSQSPGSRPQLVTLFDNQVRLVIPNKLRHP
jgi:RTX calcium-binding nonapeptide repeat (4 copies)